MSSPFQTIAETLGLTFEPSRGLVLGPRVHGVLDGQPVRCVWTDRGTRIEALLDPPLDLGLHIATKQITAGLDFGGRVVLGDSSFDDELHATADEPPRAATLFASDDVRGALLRLNAESAGITVSDDKVTAFALQYDVQASIRAVPQVARAARLLSEARAAVAASPPLAPLVRACQAFASERAFTTSNTPFRMAGVLRDVNVTFGVRRTGHRRATSELRAASATAPHGSGLLVRPESTLDRVRTFFGGQDIPTGDPAFDPAFLVQATEQDRARNALDPEVRALLLDLRSRFETVTLEGATLTTTADPTRLRPEDMASSIDMACTIVEHVARATSAVPRGPYR